MDYLSWLDFVLSPIYLLIIYQISKNIVKKKIGNNPEYNYYIKGLFFKIFAGIFLCLIYTLYYNGGDTVNYYSGGVVLVKLMGKDFSQFLTMFLGYGDKTTWWFFDYTTGWPPVYMYDDENTFFVIRFISPILLICFNSYILGTIILAWLSYIGVWRLYRFFINFYPNLQKELAYAVLFIPSVAFWGSGIMKDTITFSATGWFVYSIYQLFIKKDNRFLNILAAIISVFLILKIKPYIFVALFPGAILWVFYSKLKNIKSGFQRTVLLPFIFIIGFVLVSFVFSKLSDSLGEFGSVDKMVAKAQITQEDLKREEAYGKNYYDIGKIENDPMSMLKKAPLAIIAGMFRPFIWEARNPVMMISGIENLVMLYFTILLLFKFKIMGFFRHIASDPPILFSFTFAIFFIFAIGLSTANFGALVRYKIPAIPFYAVTLVFLYNKYKISKEKKDTNT